MLCTFNVRYISGAWNDYSAALGGKNIVMNEVADLFDEFWTEDRPTRPNTDLILHTYAYTGQYIIYTAMRSGYIYSYAVRVYTAMQLVYIQLCS